MSGQLTDYDLLVEYIDKSENCGYCNGCEKFVKYYQNYVISWVWNTRCHKSCCPNLESKYCLDCDVYKELKRKENERPKED